MRVTVVINKWWECEPAISAMLNGNASPTGAPWPSVLNSPLPRPSAKYPPFLKPRALFNYTNFDAELWCVSDQLNDAESYCQSSSSLKAALLPKIFSAGAPDLLIAVGTASSSTESPNRNGGVAIGTAVFLHDAHPNGENPLSNWSGQSDQLIASPITTKLFSQVASFDAASALLHFLPLRRNTSDAPVVTVGFDDVALGTLNVTNYGDYKYKDPETVAAYLKSGSANRAVSIETTHGLIRLSCPQAPFLFLSSITDRFGYFDGDVSAPALADAQNTAAAYNAGVALRWIFAYLDAAISAKPLAPCVPQPNPPRQQ